MRCRKLKGRSVPTVAFSESFGEGGGNSTLHYYMASAFEQIYGPPDGQVSFTGIRSLEATKLQI